MPDVPLPTPAERLAILLRWLGLAVDARRAAGLGGPLIALILDRLRHINQLVTRVAAGRFFPRRAAARRRPSPRTRPPNRLPQNFGWLLPLLPDAVGYRAQLEHLLQQPDTLALLAAAPAPLARALRPLCRMLALHPPPAIAPPVIAPPANERPKRPRRPRTPRPAPPPPVPGLPAWLQDRRKPWSLRRVRG